MLFSCCVLVVVLCVKINCVTIISEEEIYIHACCMHLTSTNYYAATAILCQDLENDKNNTLDSMHSCTTAFRMTLCTVSR